ncbi:zinc finger protein 544-like isoform X2 [Ochlerotatus camptorhynchus]|uniref:zinc finger protein 544-like isoform X2 n=1 Tax=Ochlerotatus camptorhynchus TaxID=644619 RepID=UPI0031E2BAD4
MTNTQTVLEVERLECDEKEDALSEYTPARLQAVLKYFRINPDFLKQPANFPRTLNLIANDLTEGSFQKTSTEILNAIEHWKNRIGQLDAASLAHSPDRELKRLLTAIESRLTHGQITLILQHLEVVGSDADGLWATIAVEMRALKHPPRPEIYWRRGFDEWCQEARERYQENPDELTALQQRYIEFAKDKGELDDAMEGLGVEVDALELVLNHCRTCLGVLKAADPKAYLFEPVGTGTTLADKINVCFGTGIDLEERLPKYVCWKCVEKVEGAYGLKMQIDRTDEELKSLIGEYEKRDARGIKTEHECSIEVEKVQEVETTVEGIEEEVVHSEECEEEENVKYGWYPVDDQQQMVVEQVAVSEEQEIEGFDVLVETDEHYLETDPEEALVEVKQEGQSDRIENNSARPSSKRKPHRNQIVNDLNNDFYQCPQCRVVLRTYELWKAHNARHESEKRYTCETCSKQFRSSSTLKVHQRTHTNERPYVCKMCNKRFVQSTNLIYHMKVHQGIRDYPCDQCSYKARNQNDLNLHKRSHSGARPYVCEHCQCFFSTSSNLSKHIKRRHTGERKFQCEQCDKTFNTKETVQKHMVTHTRTKPYSCPKCSFAYGWYNGLQKHMKAMHPGVPIPTEKSMIVAMTIKEGE